MVFVISEDDSGTNPITARDVLKNMGSQLGELL